MLTEENTYYNYKVKQLLLMLLIELRLVTDEEENLFHNENSSYLKQGIGCTCIFLHLHPNRACRRQASAPVACLREDVNRILAFVGVSG